MKVNFKRVATAALAVAMSLSLNVSAFAAVGDPVENGNLTVTGDQLDGKYVYAIQMFEARAQEGNGAYTFDSYELIDVWEDFFKDPTYFQDQDWKDAGVIEESETPAAITNYSDAALAYVEWLADVNQKDELMDFANDAKKWAESKDVFTRTYGADDQASVLQNVEVASAWTSYAHAQKAIKVGTDETKGTANFASLNTGYYLVYPEGGSTGKAGETQGVYTEAARGTDAMLINIPTNEKSTTWNIKSTYPTVDKTVEDNNNNTNGDGANGSAQVGDTVTFTLKSTVPDMSDYRTFYFAFNDTMSDGLQFVQKQPDPAIVDANDVTVTIEGVTVATNYYTASLTNNKLSVVFNDLRSVPGADVGDEIVVTYQAMITEAAATNNPATNSVEVEYSNDPNSGGHGTSTPDITKVYTYDIDVNKWAAGPDGNKGTEDDIANLADAQFQLTTDKAGKEVVKLVPNGTDAYRVAKPDTTRPDGYEAGAVDSFTTTESGDINISGLEAGTYYLHEVKAPDGYNKLKEPVKIEIIVSEGNYENATIEVDDEAVIGADGNVIDVENKKGIELPETGSIGTIGLTALGVVVVVAGLFAFPRKKKTRQD